MTVFLYILLGFIDISVLLLLMFTIFRWPYLPFLRSCMIIALVCSLESFVTRWIIPFPQFDLLIQIATIMVLVRLLMKANLYHAMFMSVVGALAYSEVVFASYTLMESIGIVGSEDAAATSTYGIYLIQVAGELMGVVLSLLLYKLNAGFSWISTPPHDPKRKFTGSERRNLLLNSIAVILIASTTNWVISYGGFGVKVIMGFEFLALAILLLIAVKQDARI